MKNILCKISDQAHRALKYYQLDTGLTTQSAAIERLIRQECGLPVHPAQQPPEDES